MSERRACRLTGQPRSTQRLAPPAPTDEELALRAFLRELLETPSPVGLATGRHRRQEGGLEWSTTSGSTACGGQKACVCPIKKRKKPLRGIGVAVGAFSPIRPNVVWALDFQFDQTTDGRMLKLLNVIDEYTQGVPGHRRRTFHRCRRGGATASIA